MTPDSRCTAPSSRLVRLAIAASLAGGLGSCASWRTPNGNGAGTSPAAAPRQAQVTPVKLAAEEIRRGESLVRQGFDREALAEFEKAIENNPLAVPAYKGAGDIYLQNGNLELAADRFGKAAELAPSDFDAQFKYGLSLQLLERTADAVRSYLRALAIKPDDFKGNLNLGLAYLQQGQTAESLPYAEKAVKLSPKDASAHTNLGAVYAALGRNDDAISEYLQANELAPPTPELLLNLSKAFGAAGRYEEMANTLNEAIKTVPSPAAYERLGTAYFHLKEYEKAEASFRKSLDADGKYYPAMNGIAVCLLNKYVWDQDDKARQDALLMLRRSITENRNQPRIVELERKYRR